MDMNVYDVIHHLSDGDVDVAFCIDATSFEEAWEQMKKDVPGTINEDEHSIIWEGTDEKYHLCESE